MPNNHLVNPLIKLRVWVCFGNLRFIRFVVIHVYAHFVPHRDVWDLVWSGRWVTIGEWCTHAFRLLRKPICDISATRRILQEVRRQVSERAVHVVHHLRLSAISWIEVLGKETVIWLVSAEQSDKPEFRRQRGAPLEAEVLAEFLLNDLELPDNIFLHRHDGARLDPNFFMRGTVNLFVFHLRDVINFAKSPKWRQEDSVSNYDLMEGLGIHSYCANKLLWWHL
jgi:hypothetical protein